MFCYFFIPPGAQLFQTTRNMQPKTINHHNRHKYITTNLQPQTRNHKHEHKTCNHKSTKPQTQKQIPFEIENYNTHDHTNIIRTI